MDRITFERSRAKNVGLAILSLALVAGGWLAAHNAPDTRTRVMGWAGVVFFGAGVFVGLKRAIDGGVAFTFDLSGVTVTEGSGGVIPWSEVESWSVVTIRGTRLLTLTFRDPDRSLERLAPAQRRLIGFNERMGWGHWALSFGGVSPGIDEAIQFIRERVPHVQASEP